ncbi:MAG: efflux RND transporter permease subunit [Gemmatimonadales bacterium]
MFAISRTRLRLALWFAMAVLIAVSIFDVSLYLYLRADAEHQFTADLTKAASGIVVAVRREHEEMQSTLADAAADALEEWPASATVFSIYSTADTAIANRGTSRFLVTLDSARQLRRDQVIWQVAIDGGRELRMAYASDTAIPIIRAIAAAPTTASPIEIKLFTTDRSKGIAAGRAVAHAVQTVPGLVDLFNGVAGDNVETRVRVDPVRITRLGLTVADVLDQANAALFGEPAGDARESDRLIPIRVRLPNSVRYDADIARTVPIIGPHGWAQLGTLGDVTDTTVASELLRENLRPVIKVTGNVSGSNLGSVMKGIQNALRSVALPAGVRLEYGGQYATQQQSFRQLLAVFFLAVAAVLIVLVVQFHELKSPLALAIAAPLGLTGAVLALSVTGVPFNVSSFMGLILLIGLVVKNGILLVDAAHASCDEGLPVRQALIEAGVVRMRPILMTTLCTLAGLFPLALGFGAGADLQRPLAIAVIGGLTLSTLVTLVLLPVGLEAIGWQRNS